MKSEVDPASAFYFQGYKKTSGGCLLWDRGLKAVFVILSASPSR